MPVPGEVLNSIILDRLRTTVDSKLWDHQAGFRQEKQWNDQIATLHCMRNNYFICTQPMRKINGT